MQNNCSYPKSVGLIMDGNGRWAQARGLSRKVGHTRGIINMLSLAEAAFSLGVQSFVCYSLSTENLRREKDELYHILGLVTEYENEFISLCKRHRISAKYVGRLELLPPDVLESLRRTEQALSEFSSEGRVMYIAIAYGSRAEIVSAVNSAVRQGREVDEESFLSFLSLPCELDLVIRTGGERRLSNFF